jgi:type VI secretion system secreted protein Hcp
VSIADMFLKIQGVTGEAADADHKGEIDVVSWSWGIQAPTSMPGKGAGKASISELAIVKRVDQSSPTLMSYIRSHKEVAKATLTVRKAGTTPLEYFRIELEKVRITSLNAGSEESELNERLSLGFEKIRVTYTPQGASGAAGGGANIFEADAYQGS